MLHNMAGYGDAKPKFLSWQISTQVFIATWLLLEVLSVLLSQYLYVRRSVYRKAVFNIIVQQWRFEPGTEEKYEANPL
jgi:predicted nucleic-acid-binding protein